jgi:hypothetical protein
VNASDVACASWVAAIPMPDPHQIRVARCAGAACAPLLEWRSEPLPTWVSHPPGGTHVTTEHHGFVWPAWATWTVIGVGACAAAVGILAAAGVFASAPVETHFVSGGVKVQGFGIPF